MFFFGFTFLHPLLSVMREANYSDQPAEGIPPNGGLVREVFPQNPRNIQV